MRITFFILVVFSLFWSCEHPERKTYERHQGTSNQFQNTTSEEEFVEELNTYIPSNTIEMERENGVRYIWIEVNGMRLRFIFDTGASSITISPAEATVLYRQGTLRDEDILDVEYFQDATGKISEGTKINLRQVKIGEKELTNVRATIVDNINAPLLLGQSVLERFGKIEIDYDNNQIIFK